MFALVNNLRVQFNKTNSIYVHVGSHLKFYHVGGSEPEQKEGSKGEAPFKFFHSKGMAILHLGKHWHQADTLGFIGITIY